ncbi:MAG TPA: hypothetical protein VJT73_17910 [Polyangiaceae bacterium]|nr:hypothetical protein [Polyangiaceae bacterium]
MSNLGRQSAAAQRAEERRIREDEAPRLSEKVPDLVSLSLSIQDSSASSVAQPKHVRHVVVGRAPALFLIGCSDPNCKEGGHDVTDSVMRGLVGRKTAFQGEDKCYGVLGPSPCTRVLRYEAVANYGEVSPRPAG